MAFRTSAADAGGPPGSNPCSIYATDHAFTLSGMLRFELKSWLGRMFCRRTPPRTGDGPQLLNLGCGDHFQAGFLNADFFRRSTPAGVAFWGLDLRYPLHCPDQHWEGVFTEHTLEHLHPERVRALLSELHRTMKPGAWLRMIVPDLARYVDYYVGKPSPAAFNRWQPRGAALRSVAQNYLHVSLWDEELLSDCARTAGFVDIARRTFRDGADPRLLLDTPEREYESLYLEARRRA